MATEARARRTDLPHELQPVTGAAAAADDPPPFAEPEPEHPVKEHICACGGPCGCQDEVDSEDVRAWAVRNFGRVLCPKCAPHPKNPRYDTKAHAGATR